MRKFEKLIINSIDEEIEGSTKEKLTQVKKIFEAEMLWETTPLNMYGLIQRLKDWLQGLCSAVSLPFYNHEIISWYEKELGREAKNDNECYKWVNNYWNQSALTLYHMLYN